MGKKKRETASAAPEAAKETHAEPAAETHAETTANTDAPESSRPSPSPDGAGKGDLGALVERLRNGRCLLCAGGRLGDGDLRGLVERLSGKLTDDERKEASSALDRRPLAAAGFVRRRLGDRFASELAAALPAKEPSEALRTLAALPFRAVITTGYDDLVEKTFAPERVYTSGDAAELKKDGKVRFVWKAFGDVKKAETVIWSAEDVQTALADGSYRQTAHDLYRSRSFLFVGFDGHDAELSILLDRVLAGARPDVEHYALLPGLSTAEREELHAAWNIRVIDLADAAALANQLKAAIGDQLGPVLPDDDDLDGWLAILGEEPTRADALDKLDGIERRSREAADHERLVELYLGRVGVEPTAERRGAFLIQVAKLFENELGDLGKAFTAHIAAYKETHAPEAWDELERLASATGQWTELLSDLTELVPTMAEPARAAAWLRIARLYGDKLNHVEYALTSVDEAFKLIGDTSPILDEALELQVSLLRRAERWPDLATALGRRAGRVDGAADKADMLLEKADILESRLGDGAAAVSAYREVLAADPSSDDARAALEALLRRRGQWSELLPILDEKARMAPPDDAVLIRREAAEICAERLSDKPGAIARYEALRTEAPRDLPTLRALERLYQQEGRSEQYLGTLADQADAVDSDKERAALYRRLATEWEEHPGGAARAGEWLERLLLLDGRSEDAFRSLERIYRAERKWTELVDVYRRHAVIVPGPIRGEIFAHIGAIYADELRDAPRAIEAYLDVETVLPNHAEALTQLSRLYEKTEAWDKAAETLERRVALVEVRAQKVELLLRAGEIAAERLGDARSAEARFVKVLELDSTHVAAMTALVEIYRKNGEFLKAARLLTEAVPHTQNRLEKTRLLVEAGEIFDGLEDHKKATELYLEALTVDPEHVEAGERVAELLFKAERWADLVPVLEMLTRIGARAPSNVPTPVQLERLLRLARAANSTGEKDKAQKAFTRAAELDPMSLEAQRGRAALPYDRGDYKEALPALETIAKHHAADLPPSERVDLFHQLGTAFLKTEDKPSAKSWFQKALEIDAAHRPSLLAMMELVEAKPESIIDAKKALVLTASPDEQVKLYGEIGDLYLDKLTDRVQALSAYREALELKPDDHKLLHKCLDIYSEDKSWDKALEMLERLIGVEKSPTVRARYRHAAGLIAKDELGRSEDAARLLTEALDDDPSMDRSAEALEELFRDRQEWKELARFYRKQLKRVGPQAGDGKDAERLRLWSSLGEICLDKLGERQSALAALEVALSFDRNNIERHKVLADLYVEAGPEFAEKAVGEHQLLLKNEKNRIPSYRALKQIYTIAGAREKAAAASYALTFLKKGEPEDQQLVAELKARPLTPARRALNDETWTRLQHPDEDRFLSTLFSVLHPLMAQGSAQAHKQLGLNRKEALEANDGRPFAKAFRYVSATFGFTAANTPEVYLRADQKEPLQILNALDKNAGMPVWLVGAPLLSEKRNERELVFEISRRLAWLRPERALRWVLPEAQLALLVDAVVAFAAETDNDKTAVAPAPEVQKTRDNLKKSLQPVPREQVLAVGRKLKGVRSAELVGAWLKAADLTASRAGYAMVGDLETCARLLAAEAQSSANLPTVQRLLDLVWSSVSEDVFSVRKHLGTL
jgi:tetratricopeptide (TPR) repeat protein